jgi:hypothetical protein
MAVSARLVNLFLAAALVSGCAEVKLLGGEVPERQPLPGGQGTVMLSKTGLALSGGGSKSAPFEIGVLAGLRETGVLKEVQILSSVSGGSYAALHYYARLLSGDSSADDPFLDCLPARYVLGFAADAPPPNWSPRDPNGLCPDKAEEHGYDGLYWPVAGDPGDPLKQASHLRGFQDVFGKQFDYTATTHARWNSALRISELLAINSGLMLAPSLVANSLFDWRLDLSPSKERYGTGILRAYGTDAIDFSDPRSPTHRAQGDVDSTARLTFDALRHLYEQRAGGNGRFPLWIINATAGTARLKSKEDDGHHFTGRVHGFEFSPYGYGSLAYGFHRWRAKELEPTMEIAAAVGASAAFFDPQQKTAGGPITGALINGFLHLANFSWGTDIKNYNLSRRDFSRQRIVHGFLPWPIYLAHRRRETDKALYIHLSDGGQSENLGVAALLRRNVKNIIVVDAASDEDYEFEDVCTLAKQLADRDNPVNALTIHMDGFPGLTEDCESIRGKLVVKHKLRAPILFGRICRGRVPSCTDDDAASFLYLIKPAVNETESFPRVSLKSLMDAGESTTLQYDDCNDTSHAYPCEVVLYWPMNIKYGFPQHSTVFMTSNSSPYLYGAYKELGRFYARQLEVSKPGSVRAFCVNARWQGRVESQYLCRE